MTSLKDGIIQSFYSHPLRMRFLLVLVGVLAGLAWVWYGRLESAELSLGWLFILGGFSTLVYTPFLTLYRILQQIFRRRLEARGAFLEFDERVLVGSGGLFLLLPFGVTSFLWAYFRDAGSTGFGKITMVQGLALGLSAWLSQKIKR